MNNKQRIIFKYYVNAEMQDYNIRSKVLDRHIKDVYPQARTVMRYDERLKLYYAQTVAESFVFSITEDIIEILAGIIAGLLKLDSVIYQIGLNRPVTVTKRLKENRDSWYVDAGEDDELLEGVN